MSDPSEDERRALRVELTKGVWNVVEGFTVFDRDSFVSCLERVRRAPIRNSEASHDPGCSDYMLRFFRFGSGERWIAVFELDIGQNLIKVLECRLLRPRRRPGNGQSGRGDPG